MTMILTTWSGSRIPFRWRLLHRWALGWVRYWIGSRRRREWWAMVHGAIALLLLCVGPPSFVWWAPIAWLLGVAVNVVAMMTRLN